MTATLEFYVTGAPMRGELTVPDGAEPVRTVVLSPDWLADEDVRMAAGTACRGAGLGVFSYGPAAAATSQHSAILRPHAWLLALRAAIARLHAEPAVAEHGIGVLGIGPVAAGVAVLAAADDPWIRAVCVRNLAFSGSEWLHNASGLDERAWTALTADAAARLRAATTDGRFGTIALPPAARAAGLPQELELASFDHLHRFRPGESLPRIAASRLRVTHSTDGAVPAEAHEFASDAKWLLDNLQFSPYEVSAQT